MRSDTGQETKFRVLCKGVHNDNQSLRSRCDVRAVEEDSRVFASSFGLLMQEGPALHSDLKYLPRAAGVLKMSLQCRWLSMILHSFRTSLPQGPPELRISSRRVVGLAGQLFRLHAHIPRSPLHRTLCYPPPLPLGGSVRFPA